GAEPHAGARGARSGNRLRDTDAGEGLSRSSGGARLLHDDRRRARPARDAESARSSDALPPTATGRARPAAPRPRTAFSVRRKRRKAGPDRAHSAGTGGGAEGTVGFCGFGHLRTPGTRRTGGTPVSSAADVAK